MTTKKQHTIRYIGKRIRDYRLKKHLTQKDAALRIGINVSRLNQIETGKANAGMKTLIQIEDNLGVQLFI